METIKKTKDEQVTQLSDVAEALSATGEKMELTKPISTPIEINEFLAEQQKLSYDYVKNQPLTLISAIENNFRVERYENGKLRIYNPQGRSLGEHKILEDDSVISQAKANTTQQQIRQVIDHVIASEKSFSSHTVYSWCVLRFPCDYKQVVSFTEATFKALHESGRIFLENDLFEPWVYTTTKKV